MVARIAGSLLVTLVLTLASSSAEAAPSVKDRAQAKTLWTKGKRFAAQQNLDEAITALRAACELDPKAQYQLDLARALESDGLLVEARDTARLVEDSKEPNTQRAKKVAEELRVSLDARIPRLKVSVESDDPAGIAVRVGSEDVEADRETEFDPGPYVVRAQGPNGASAEQRVKLEERERRTVRLVMRGGRASKEPVSMDDGKGTMIPAIVAYGIGGAGLVVGGIFGVQAYRQTSAVNEVCGGVRCPRKYLPDIELALEYGNVSTVGFAAGGLALAAGLALTFTVGRDREPASTDASLRPVVGPGFVGIDGRF